MPCRMPIGVPSSLPSHDSAWPLSPLQGSQSTPHILAICLKDCPWGWHRRHRHANCQPGKDSGRSGEGGLAL